MSFPRFRTVFFTYYTFTGFLLISIFSGCHYEKKLIASGSYDRAIDWCMEKISKNPARHDREKEALELAFAQAQKKDFAEISSLKQGIPSSWPDLYSTYDRIDRRQQKVMQQAPYFIRKQFRSINLDTVSVAREKEEARGNAVQFLYAEADKKLATGRPFDARNAFADYQAVQRLQPGLNGLSDKLAKAEAAGKVYIYASFRNQTRLTLPSTVTQPFLTSNLPTGLSGWISGADKAENADYLFITSLRLAEVSPERITETRRTETQSIQDGWVYEYDRKGNILKDTAGNDIRRPRMITKTAIVTEHIQNREAVISGTIQMTNGNSSDEIRGIPFKEQIIFEHRYITFRGDKLGLRPETARRLNVGPLPYPTPEKMLSDLFLRIRPRWRDFIRDQQNILLRD